jgi:ankyrin repeat protein
VQEHSQESGSTALIHAASHGHAQCTRLLIDAGADMEVKNGRVRYRIAASDM